MQSVNRPSHQSRNHTARHSRQINDFGPRASRHQPVYERRSKGIIPGNEAEYMIALSPRASQRTTVQPVDDPRHFFEDLISKNRRRLTGIASPKSKKILPGIVVLLAISFGVFGLMSGTSNNSVTADPDLRQILEDNGDTPNDKRPYNLGNYVVSPDMPRALKIQKLGIASRVVRLSARENSEPMSPQNIYDVGWYENSAKPGEPGASLMIGHKQGSEKQGVFYDLTRLVPGDEFQLELGDGTVKNYQIIKMDTYQRGQVDYTELTSSASDTRPGLNLLTAIGAFQSNAEVTQQLAVFAVERINTDEY